MLETKNFDLALAEERGEALKFILGEREFSCPLPIPAISILELSLHSSEGDEEGIQAFYDFLLSTIDSSQVEDFKTVLNEQRVSFNVLLQIVTWIVEASVARPTNGASDLVAPLSMNGNQSNPESVSTGSEEAS